MKRVTRITNTPAHALRITFNAIGRSLEWETANGGGTPQDVDDSVAEAIANDASLAPHFKIDPIVAGAGAGVVETTKPAAAVKPPAVNVKK